MSDDTKSTESSSSSDQPGAGQFSGFRFSDAEVEEQVQADRNRRQAEATTTKAAPAAEEDDFTFIDTPVSVSERPEAASQPVVVPPAPPKPIAAPPVAPASPAPTPPARQAARPAQPAAPVASPAPPTGVPSVAGSVPAGARPTAAIPPATKPPAGATPKEGVPRGAAPKVPTPTVPTPQSPATGPQAPRGVAPQVPLPQIPSPQIPSPQAPQQTSAARQAGAQRAAGAAPTSAASQADAARPGAAGVGVPPATGAAPGGSAPTGAPRPRPAGAPAQGGAPGQPARRAQPAGAANPDPQQTAASLAPKIPAISSNVGTGGQPSAAATTSGTSGMTLSELRPPAWRQFLDKLDPVAGWIIALALAASGLALLYILWGIYGGGLRFLANEEPEKVKQVADNLQIATTTLKFGLSAAALASLILFIDESWVGPSIAVLGVAMTFGAFPALHGIGKNQAVNSLITGVMTCGYPLLGIGLLKSLIDLIRWLIDLPNRASLRADVGVATKAEAAQQRVAASANMFSPCWQLPFCREIIRKQCPAYIARKRCWKFGRGCYCDEEMISRIVRGESQDMVKAPTRMSRQGKPPCGRCYIFLEHQRLKYIVVSPLALPITIIGAYLLWPLWERLVASSGGFLQGLWGKLSYSVATTAVSTTVDPESLDKYRLNPEQVQHVAQGMFGVILGFFALIYISKFIEWAIYKAKW